MDSNSREDTRPPPCLLDALRASPASFYSRKAIPGTSVWGLLVLKEPTSLPAPLTIRQSGRSPVTHLPCLPGVEEEESPSQKHGIFRLVFLLRRHYAILITVCHSLTSYFFNISWLFNLPCVIHPVIITCL